MTATPVRQTRRSRSSTEGVWAFALVLAVAAAVTGVWILLGAVAGMAAAAAALIWAVEVAGGTRRAGRAGTATAWLVLALTGVAVFAVFAEFLARWIG